MKKQPIYKPYSKTKLNELKLKLYLNERQSAKNSGNHSFPGSPS
jgi:hypothetical protein